MKLSLPNWLSKHWVFIAVLLTLFILPIFIPREYFEGVKSFVVESNPVASIFVLALILIVSTVIAPLNTLALVPFASALFGWEIIFVTLVVSWTVGAVIAFLIARRFGQPALRALGILDDVMSMTSKIPSEHMFSAIVLLRMFIPVDVLSYCLGLISDISLSRYILATAIGITPFSFIWSYAGEAAISREYASLSAIAGLGLIVILVSVYFFEKQKRAGK